MVTETRVRKNIRCCKCRKLFSLLIDTAGEPEISLTCLHCGAPLHINLAQYPRTETEVMRVAKSDGPKTLTICILPDVLETIERVV